MGDNICFNYQNHGRCHFGKRCRFLHIENDHFNSKPRHGENRYANFNKQNNFSCRSNFNGASNTAAVEQSESHGGRPKAVRTCHGSATPMSAASAFTSISKSRNSVLPDSGASADGKSLKKKRGRKRVRRSRKKKDRSDPALNIYYVKMNGFRSKKDSLKQILCEHDVDMWLVTETKVHTNSSIKLEGYQLFP